MALIREFVSAVRGGQPLVKQMLMGGGKTTVVGPMLALMLADGEMLVVQTMPQVQTTPHHIHSGADHAAGADHAPSHT